MLSLASLASLAAHNGYPYMCRSHAASTHTVSTIMDVIDSEQPCCMERSTRCGLCAVYCPCHATLTHGMTRSARALRRPTAATKRPSPAHAVSTRDGSKETAAASYAAVAALPA